MTSPTESPRRTLLFRPLGSAADFMVSRTTMQTPTLPVRFPYYVEYTATPVAQNEWTVWALLTERNLPSELTDRPWMAGVPTGRYTLVDSTIKTSMWPQNWATLCLAAEACRAHYIQIRHVFQQRREIRQEASLAASNAALALLRDGDATEHFDLEMPYESDEPVCDYEEHMGRQVPIPLWWPSIDVEGINVQARVEGLTRRSDDIYYDVQTSDGTPGWWLADRERTELLLYERWLVVDIVGSVE